MSRLRSFAFVILLGAPWAAACSGGGDVSSTTTGATHAGGAGGAAGGVCRPGEVVECFSGAPEQKNVGLCKAGQQTCNAEGTGFGPCEGEVLPTAETCGNPGDEDCDGLINEEGADCICNPGEKQPCYSGPPSTKGVGPCKGGTQICNALGNGWGPCTGEVTPVPETCATGIDDDCDGKINESGAGCQCLPNTMVTCYSGPAGTANVGACKSGKAQCNAQGTAIGPCMGDITPKVEACLSPTDDDCDGKTNETTDCSCAMGDVIACYTGAAGTEGVGVCHGGQRTCLGGALGYGPCTGEVKPTTENCATTADENCNGSVNEGCACSPAEIGSCYTGPAMTANVGACHGGTRVCKADGLGWGACTGDVVPVTEICANGIDDDCDGVVDEREWNETTVDIHTPGLHSALVVDAAGGVHALYHDAFFDYLIYAYKPFGGTFTKTTVDVHTPSGDPKLVVDAAGGVHALYHDASFDYLIYAYKPASGSFTKTTVDVHEPGDDPQLVVDVAGGVHALYHDVFFDYLIYANKPAGGAFTKTTVDVHTPSGFPKLVVDASGGVHTLYHDAFFDYLMYANKPAGGAFAQTTVDIHPPGDDPRLVVDANGGLHALYFDTFFDDLDYAYRCP